MYYNCFKIKATSSEFGYVNIIQVLLTTADHTS